MNLRNIGSLHVLLTSFVLAGCATSGGGGATQPAPNGELEALFEARTDSARTRFTQADVSFVTSMIAHHSQALTASAFAPTKGAGPAVRTLAARITNGQMDEIATMQQWLRDRGQAVPEVRITDGVVTTNIPEHSLHMPGMLTPDDMRQLEEARGTAFDMMFLSLMIQHHQGAVAMVQELFRTDGAGQDEEVFRIASDIQVDQNTEIERMRTMLDALASGRPIP